MTQTDKRLRRVEPLSNTMLLTLISIGIFILMYAAAIIFNAQGFRNPKMIVDLLNENSMLIIIACALTVVMIGGGINISVGGVVRLTCMACALSLEKIPTDGTLTSTLLALGIALGIGLAFGALMGYLISYLEIQPFIVTLAGMFLAQGLTSMLSSTPVNVGTTNPFQNVVNTKIPISWLSYENVKRGKVNIITPELEIGAVVAVAVVVLIFLMLRFTKQGRNIYAIGGNQQSAMMLGVNVKRTRFLSYLISGLLSGLAGFVFLMHKPAGNTSVATRAEMDAIAASIIGGTLLTGGVGNIFGTFFGVMILATITKIIGLSKVNASYLQEMASGAMLGIFILMQSIILSARGKRGGLKAMIPPWLRRQQPEAEAVSLFGTAPAEAPAAEPVRPAADAAPVAETPEPAKKPAPARPEPIPGKRATAAITPMALALDPTDEIFTETAGEVIPAAINGLQMYRCFTDVPVDPAHYDVSQLSLGQPAHFVQIGMNLFVRSGQHIMGRVTDRRVVRQVSDWLLSGKPIAAVVTDADASDRELKVTVALYDDLLKVAREKGARLLRLRGGKSEEAQRNIALARVGDPCGAAFEKHGANGKGPRWKVYTADGYVGTLPEDEYKGDGSMRIVVAEVDEAGDNGRAVIRVYVV